MKRKRRHSNVHRKCTTGHQHQAVKVQVSSISNKELKEKETEAFINSDKVLSNKSIKLEIEILHPSNVLIFSFCHMPHMKQWGIMLQSATVFLLPNIPYQLVNSSTPFSITHLTPKHENTLHQSSQAIEQWRRK